MKGTSRGGTLRVFPGRARARPGREAPAEVSGRLLGSGETPSERSRSYVPTYGAAYTDFRASADLYTNEEWLVSIRVSVRPAT